MKKLSLLFLFLFSLSFLTPAQTSQQQPEKTPPRTPNGQEQRQQKPLPWEPDQPAEKVHKVTPDEAKDLFRWADEILRFASRDTLLPIKRSVKKSMVSRRKWKNTSATSSRTMWIASA